VTPFAICYLLFAIGRASGEPGLGNISSIRMVDRLLACPVHQQ
jgi:hypothetical protein